MSGELVGPLRRIYYANGTMRAYDLPRNTFNLRYDACPAHHPACDCREAMTAEAWGEHMAEIRVTEDAIEAAIKGHNTYAYTADGWPDKYSRCKCSACDIARAARVGRIQAMRESRENEKRLWAEHLERERIHWARVSAESGYSDEPPF